MIKSNFYKFTDARELVKSEESNIIWTKYFLKMVR